MSPEQLNEIQSLLIANAKAPESNVGVLSIDTVIRLVPKMVNIAIKDMDKDLMEKETRIVKLEDEIKSWQDRFFALTGSQYPDTAGNKVINMQDENESLRKERDTAIANDAYRTSLIVKEREEKEAELICYALKQTANEWEINRLRTRLNELVESLENAKVYGAVVWFGDDTEALTPCILESDIQQLIQKAKEGL